MIKIVAYGRGKKSHDFNFVEMSFKFAQMNDSIHHLSHTKAMAKVMKWIVAIVGLNAELFWKIWQISLKKFLFV